MKMLLEKVHSKIDKTIKFVFQLEDKLISEASYINKDDGKDIICVGTHTGCNLGCIFCHTTDCKDIIVRSLEPEEIYNQVQFIREDLKLKDKMLLVSYMGCGEPLTNMWGLLSSMMRIKRDIQPSRFAVATLIPAFAWDNFFTIVKEIRLCDLPVKIHLSLHFVRDTDRKQWMPAALPIEPAIAALEFYRKYSGNSVEVHYALIDDVNDDSEDAEDLAHLLNNRDIPVKLLKYNERKTINNKASDNVENFMRILEWSNIPVEYYEPPGWSIGASCGQFLMEYYLKYNKNFIVPIDK